MRNTLIIAIAGLLLLLQASCKNEAKNVQAAEPEIVCKDNTCILIDNYLKQIASEKNFSGALLIVKNKQKVFSKGYGWAIAADKVPFTSSTLCSMGSITKHFTATAIMKLKEQGKIKTEQKLSEFFPSVPDDKNGITIHQLLTHSSGFTELLDGDGGDYEKIETEAYLQRVFKQPLAFEPGTRAIYTNVGMSVLAIILEKVSGLSYEDYLRKHLFQPAGIKHLGYQYPKEEGTVVAHGYQGGKDWGTHQQRFDMHGGGPYWNLKGNGGLEVSLNDMYRWINALSEYTILSRENVELMFTPHMVEDQTMGYYYFGYGCNISKSRRGTKVVDNGGSNGIYYARMLRYPEDDVVFYVMTNEAEVPAEKVISNVVQLYFNGKIEQDAFQKSNRFDDPQSEEILKIMDGGGAVSFAKNMEHMGIKINNDMALLQAGLFLREAGRVKDATALFEYYTQSFPKIIVAHNELAELYVLAGRKDDAIKEFDAALKLAPQNERAKEGMRKLKF